MSYVQRLEPIDRLYPMAKPGSPRKCTGVLQVLPVRVSSIFASEPPQRSFQVKIDSQWADLARALKLTHDTTSFFGKGIPQRLVALL
jgi:hypothetical protein